MDNLCLTIKGKRNTEDDSLLTFSLEDDSSRNVEYSGRDKHSIVGAPDPPG